MRPLYLYFTRMIVEEFPVPVYSILRCVKILTCLTSAHFSVFFFHLTTGETGMTDNLLCNEGIFLLMPASGNELSLHLSTRHTSLTGSQPSNLGKLGRQRCLPPSCLSPLRGDLLTCLVIWSQISTPPCINQPVRISCPAKRILA